MKLFLDIETIGTDRQDVRDYIAASVSPPGNYSKAETIAKWNEESRPAAIEEAVAKTGLDGAFGRVCVIGWAIDNDEPIYSASADDEAFILREFASDMKTVTLSDRHTTTVIGHNVSAFDLRFLMQRFIINGIKPPMVIARAAQAKPWEAEKVFDTMVQWNPERDKRISLEKLCLAMGIESPKTDLDGSKVWQYVKDGRIKEVADYCLRDVVATRQIYNRMTFSTQEVFDDVPA